MNFCPKPLLVVNAITIVMLAGCGTSGQAGIEGAWQIVRADQLTSRVNAEDTEKTGESPKMTIHFDNSGNLRTETNIGHIKSTKDGSWTFLSYDADSSTMQIECTLQAQTTRHNIKFEDADTIYWIPPNLAGTDQKIRFVRSAE